MNHRFVTARSEATRQSMHFGCHCKRCAAIHAGTKTWIATAFGLAMTKGRHCEERSDAAIHAGTKTWIATAFGLAMTGWGSGLAMTRGRDDDRVRREFRKDQ